MKRTSLSKPTWAILTVGLFTGLMASPAFAQQRWFNPEAAAVGTVFGGPFAAGVYGGWGAGGFGGGTAAGNELFGASQVIRAKGDYNEATSRAYINYEDARKSYIASRREWTDTYFAMREQNESRRVEALARQKHSTEALQVAGRANLPPRLSYEVLDPITGRITWPELLERPEFTRPRQRISNLLEVRAATSSAGIDRAAARETVLEMVEILKNNIEAIPTNDYIATRKFLDSLYMTLS